MLNLPQKTFEKIKKTLLRQQKEIEADLTSIKQDDPVNGDSLAESSEPGTESWLADMHGRALAIRQNLEQLLNKTRQSLAKIRSGKYGKCESCGKNIELERLEVIPTATLCLACSKKRK